MDQDFHYYGTFYAARVAGFGKDDATLIAKCANFIDFLHESDYAGYWQLVKETAKSTTYNKLETVDYPRYTFQAGMWGTFAGPEDGLWASYHFPPGNYADPTGTPTLKSVHGDAVAGRLPVSPSTGAHEVRATTNVDTPANARLLNRPMSPLSRAMLNDAISLATNPSRLTKILRHARGGSALVPSDPTAAKKILDRFNLILLGVRAHVIADTWAHQDFSAISNAMNTYYDVNDGSGNPGTEKISYLDTGSTWKTLVLSRIQNPSNKNLEAAPSGTSYLGHGWMGHFPDFSFVKFKYRPGWRKSTEAPIERDNPTQYKAAFLELCSLFKRALGATLNPEDTAVKGHLANAATAISTGCDLSVSTNIGRKFSEGQWLTQMSALGEPSVKIDCTQEPDPKAVLEGVLEKPTGLSSATRYGTFTVGATSDIYLFQIAVDYQFQFVKRYLKNNNIMTFSGSWSQHDGPLPSTGLEALFT